jgi:hypothetical protein
MEKYNTESLISEAEFFNLQEEKLKREQEQRRMKEMEKIKEQNARLLLESDDDGMNVVHVEPSPPKKERKKMYEQFLKDSALETELYEKNVEKIEEQLPKNIISQICELYNEYEILKSSKILSERNRLKKIMNSLSNYKIESVINNDGFERLENQEELLINLLGKTNDPKLLRTRKRISPLKSRKRNPQLRITNKELKELSRIADEYGNPKSRTKRRLSNVGQGSQGSHVSQTPRKHSKRKSPNRQQTGINYNLLHNPNIVIPETPEKKTIHSKSPKNSSSFGSQSKKHSQLNTTPRTFSQGNKENLNPNQMLGNSPTNSQIMELLSGNFP